MTTYDHEELDRAIQKALRDTRNAAFDLTIEICHDLTRETNGRACAESVARAIQVAQNRLNADPRLAGLRLVT